MGWMKGDFGNPDGKGPKELWLGFKGPTSKEAVLAIGRGLTFAKMSNLPLSASVTKFPRVAGF